MRLVLIPPLVIAVTALVIIGLVNFDLLMAIVPKLIVAIIAVGVPMLVVKMMFFPK
ncbi:MAG: hypothetical protein J7J88_03040 [Dehalococcoidia bacterium]|nr:hypothetical protein [Dehalococcoidia bacterium]